MEGAGRMESKRIQAQIGELENEKNKALKEDFHQSDKKEAEKLLNSGTARKRMKKMMTNPLNLIKLKQRMIMMKLKKKVMTISPIKMMIILKKKMIT